MFAGLTRLLAAFGSSSIDVYEWEEKDIRKTRLPNGPVWSNLTTAHSKLQFTGWQLAHAVVKADYLVERDLLLPGLGFILQIDRIVDLASSNLKLVPGSSLTLNDFTRTSLTGRIGQGLSILFAIGRGFEFVCHLASDPNVASHVATLPKKRRKAADFLFESSSAQRMILESKASFTQAANSPTAIKSTLKAALTGQVDYWMSRVNPPASKGFAVYSCLREVGNPVPSALIFVDPPRQRIRNPVEFPSARVRRHNYAAWLAVMGLNESARNLLRPGKQSRTEIELPIIQIGSQKFVVSIQFTVNKETRLLGAGLNVTAVKAISAALDDDDGPLLDLGAAMAEDVLPLGEVDEFGSVFPDGSYFGPFGVSSAFQGYETFLL